MGTPKNPDTYFVGIQDTRDLKRALLEATRDTVVFLQRYENFNKIKNEKNETIAELKKRIKEISSVVADLKRKLPESELHKKLNKEEISVEKDIIGIGIKKKKLNAVKSVKQAEARDTSRKDDINKAEDSSNNKSPKKSQKEKKISSEMEKLEDQLKQLEGRLKQFE